MNIEVLRLIRNILLRSFIIGLVIALMLGFATMAGWEIWMPLATRWFHVDEATLAPLVMEFFVNIRFFLLFVILTPGLAIHWTLKKEMDKKPAS